MIGSDLLERIRRPEYTGRNRCLPCTLVNLALVTVSAAVVARRRRSIGVLLGAVGIGLIGLRGYVVPGTPVFAPRLVEPLPIEFGHSEESRESLRATEQSIEPGADSDPEGLLATLVAAGIVERDGDELILEEEFREEWRTNMTSLRGASPDEFSDRVAAACPVDIAVVTHGDRIILAGVRDVRTSRTIAIAETAAIETMREWDVPGPVRARAATPLRTFLRTCPGCGGPVRETTIRNCCGGPSSVTNNPEQPVMACADCESVVVEL